MHNENSALWIFLTNISSSVLALATAGWLIRTIINHWLGKDFAILKTQLNQDAERFKADLQRINQHEVERLHAELQKLETEHQIRFSKLHEKQFETVAELYKRIVIAHATMWNYLKPYVPVGDSDENTRRLEAAEAWNRFRIFALEHEIYFDAPTCTLIHTYLEELRDLHTMFEGRKFDPKRRDTWEKAWERLNSGTAALKKSLESEFRKNIGIE